MNVAHQPIEDADIAVYRNVYVFQGLGIAQVLLKILHMGDQKGLIASEVLVEFLVFVANVDYDLSSRWLDAVSGVQRVNPLLLQSSSFSSILLHEGVLLAFVKD